MTATAQREHNSTYGYDASTTGPHATRKYLLKSGAAVYKGTHICLDADGWAVAYTPRGDHRYAGVNLTAGTGTANVLTGDGSTVYCSVDISGRIELMQSVTGASARTDNRKPVFVVDSGEAYTLTPQSPAQQPVGEVVEWQTSTYCTILLYPVDALLPLYVRNQMDLIYGRTRQRLTKDWPLLPDETQAATTDNDFDTTGTSPGTEAFHAGGGVDMVTGGSTNNQAKLWALAVSAWAGPFAPSRRPVFISKFKTGASIASVKFSTGLRLTDVIDLTTDADQIGVKYDTGNSDTTLIAFYSIAGVDTAVDTGVTLVASTNYTAAFVVREDGYGEVYVGDGNTLILKRVAVTTSAMTAAAALIPQPIAVQTLTGAAKTVTTRYIEISQDHE